MADKTGIEWTDATWNPLVGCTIVSKGCTNCYAMKQAGRIIRMAGGAGQATHYAGTVKDSKAGPVWTGKVNLAPDATLTQPLRWKRPRRIFVNSMSDLFHEGVSDETIDRIFAVMALCPQHTFQVLTKRPERMRTYMDKACGRIADAVMVLRRKTGIGAGTGLAPLPHITPGRAWWPLPNVWLGTSVEDQATADERIPHLLATPAAVRFVSAEPLLGLVDFIHLQPGDPPVEIDSLNGTHGVLRPHGGRNDKLDWIIVGGESGPGARPMHPDWARSIRDQCAAAGTAFLFKQWGEWAPAEAFGACKWGPITDQHGNIRNQHRYYVECEDRADRLDAYSFDGHWTRPVFKVGKKRAGRTLDGVIHDGYPEALS